jgi:uncharacterized protein DUF3105
MAGPKRGQGKDRGQGSPSGRPVRRGSRSPADRAEARRRREEIERQGLRRRRIRRLLILGGLFVAVAGFLAVQLFTHRLSSDEQRLLDQAPAAAVQAGCTGVRAVLPYPGGNDRTHVGGADMPNLPALSTYSSVPPASGPHSPVPLPAGVYTRPPDIGQAIHSLEHAAVIIWLDPSAMSDPQVEAIKAFFSQGDHRNHVIVAPFDYPNAGSAGRLPDGRQMALVAWHRIRYCGRPSLPVAFDFVYHYRYDLYHRGAYRGEAPEKFAPI